MPENVLRIGPETFSVVVGIIVLLGAALAFAFKYHAGSDKAGARGHRPPGEAHQGEVVRPDGFIDSFAGAIAEAGGGMPFMATIIMLTTLVTWFVYLIINWRG